MMVHNHRRLNMLKYNNHQGGKSWDRLRRL